MNPKLEAIWEKTKKLVRDNDRIRELLRQSADKVSAFADQEESRSKLIDKVKLVMRMIRAQLAGDYHAFSARTMFLMVFSIVYFVMPADMIPDFIPMLGFSDDITVLYFITESIASDIEAFREWEANN